MIRANCRARFTAADFDFIVRTLARSLTDQVSLVDLLSDLDSRDSRTSVFAPRARRQLLAFHQRHFSRERTAPQFARRTGYRILRAGWQDQLSTCGLARRRAPLRT